MMEMEMKPWEGRVSYARLSFFRHIRGREKGPLEPGPVRGFSRNGIVLRTRACIHHGVEFPDTVFILSLSVLCVLLASRNSFFLLFLLVFINGWVFSPQRAIDIFLLVA